MKIGSHKAKNLSDALEQLNKYGDRGKIIAGGTDIVIELKNKEIAPEIMIDISDIDEIKQIREVDGYIEIGSAVTFTDIVNSEELGEKLKGLIDAAHSVGSPQIRNTGTIGGNICNGSPAADTVPPLLALDSIALVKSVDGQREIALKEFFLNKGSVALKNNEMLTAVRFKKPSGVLSFSKLGLRKALAISRICTSVYLEVEDGKISKARVGNGAVGRYGLREESVEDFLSGKKLCEETIEESVDFMGKEIENRLEGRSSMEFKSEAVKGIFRSALEEAVDYLK